MPRHASKSQVWSAFKSANADHSQSHSSNTNQHEMDFSEFMDCMGRIHKVYKDMKEDFGDEVLFAGGNGGGRGVGGRGGRCGSGCSCVYTFTNSTITVNGHKQFLRDMIWMHENGCDCRCSLLTMRCQKVVFALGISMPCPSLLGSRNLLFVLMSFSTTILAWGLGFTYTRSSTQLQQSRSRPNFAGTRRANACGVYRLRCLVRYLFIYRYSFARWTRRLQSC